MQSPLTGAEPAKTPANRREKKTFVLGRGRTRPHGYGTWTWTSTWETSPARSARGIALLEHFLPLLRPAPTAVRCGRARAAGRRQGSCLRRELGSSSGCAGRGGRVLRLLGQGHGVSFPAPAVAAVHRSCLAVFYRGMIGPRSGPRGGGTTRPRTAWSCTQLGGLVLLAGLPRQLPGDDEVEPGADGDQCLAAAQWMDVFRGFYHPGARGRRRSKLKRDHGRRLCRHAAQ